MSDTNLGPRRLEEHPAVEDETIRRVLRLVGPRPAVPEDAMAEARAAAYAEWQLQVRAQARWGRVRSSGVWLAAAAALLTAGLLFRERLLPAAPAAPVAFVERTAEPVRLTSGGEPRPLQSGEEIVAGAVVDTATGRGALRLASGPSVRLDAETRVRMVSPSVLELLRGGVYVDSADASTVEVQTALGVARDVGTQFEVRLTESALRIRVREGKVLFDRGGQSHEAEAGVELRVAPGGAVTRGTVAVYGPDWDWVLASAAGFRAEGQSLRSFLDWLCREGGWTLSFTGDELAARAETTILDRGMEGLEPLDAAGVALMGSDLQYRLEESAFVVESR